MFLFLALNGKAEEKFPTYLETAVSGTQISGYVASSAIFNFNGTVNPQVVPEPTTIELLTAGVIVVGFFSRRKKQ